MVDGDDRDREGGVSGGTCRTAGKKTIKKESKKPTTHELRQQCPYSNLNIAFGNISWCVVLSGMLGDCE